MDIVSTIDRLISDTRLGETLSDMVNIASPTGEETPLATYIAQTLKDAGLTANTQKINETQSNAVAKISGEGDTTLLLYAPMDTVTSNSEAEDLPWVGAALRPDMRANACVKDGHVYGLGAHNPKGHGACIIEVARVLSALNIGLPGTLLLGFGAGGMPTHGRAGFPHDSGHGSGCAHMVTHSPKIDAAIIAKSGTSVTWEEVGFLWIEVSVAGQHNYVGARHLMPYDNAIANAAKLILKLEDWFDTYAEKHATDLCRPQGTISHMRSGWERMPAFTPAHAKFLIDLRFTPQQTANTVETEFADVLQTLCEELGLTVEYKIIQTIEASHTAPTDPIIRTTIDIWERLQGRDHEPFTVMSGATDANILRGRGIPTARIGLAKADLPDMDFALGMNSVAVSELRYLTKFLVLSVLHYFGKLSHG